ncbi:MAG TPA: hemolysin III family protein [Deltaproteobacteria bacterium]|nr:hemolysin III family protein [Deltaproteobacteria bacterium]
MKTHAEASCAGPPLRGLCAYLRDPVSALTHLTGALLAILGLIALVRAAVHPVVKPWHIVAFSIFGAGLICLYTASGLYHAMKISEEGIRILRRVDHMMIFILIAATYTPFCLISLRGGWGWSIFGVVWGLALLGILIKIFWIEAPRWLSTIIYIGMGWVVLVCMVPLVAVLTSHAMFWLCLGGVSYTIGAIIYAVRWPNPWPRVLGFHEIFHVLVMGGSLAHFWVIYRYV